MIKKGSVMDKDKMLQEVYEKAKAYELKGGNCAQCSIAAIFEVLGVNDENVIRAATSLADGVGLSGDGHLRRSFRRNNRHQLFLRQKKEDMARMGKNLKALLLAKKLHAEFVKEFSTCRWPRYSIKQFGRFFDMCNMEDLKAAQVVGMAEQCSTLVGKVARMALEIILEEREKEAKKAKQEELPIL